MKSSGKRHRLLSDYRICWRSALGNRRSLRTGRLSPARTSETSSSSSAMVRLSVLRCMPSSSAALHWLPRWVRRTSSRYCRLNCRTASSYRMPVECIWVTRLSSSRFTSRPRVSIDCHARRRSVPTIVTVVMDYFGCSQLGESFSSTCSPRTILAFNSSGVMCVVR